MHIDTDTLFRRTARLLVAVLLPLLLLAACGKREYSDQGRTSACWIYAMLACIEQEQLRYGDSVTLSRQWLMSRLMEEQTMERYLAGREISMRGVGPDALRLIENYGLIPFRGEKGDITNSHVLERELRLLADHHHGTLKTLHERVEEKLPRFTVNGTDGSATFYYYGMRYTALQFAESIMYHQQWQWYASVTYHPWGVTFPLEVADNRRYHIYLNIPMPQLIDKVLASLRAGHPVYWEYGREASAQPQGGGASSDHAVAIVALRKGSDGKPRLLCRNSYGTAWGQNGHFLVSLDFFRQHTCNVGILEPNSFTD